MTDKNNETDAAEPVESSETTDLQSQLDAATATAEENMLGWKRAQADYQNLQKETQKRIQDMAQFATAGFVTELLPMVDHFKYALNGIPAEERDNAWVKGIEYIQQNFMKILEEHGVEVMNPVGQPFNPEEMEAVEEVEGDGESGIVVEEVATGFKMNGKLLQAAKVKVIK